ncbi:4-oxalocrotonate tautomerase [Xylogone sp. PMI_703]|nr:4-oxalocrotonate tautomerase [Xylogone sp. PMI_703]
MPTYVCTTAAGRLSPEQKQRIVESLSEVHSEEANTPKFIVQVIFHEVLPGQHYINERPVTTDQVWIRGDIRAGRTDEQKEAMLSRMVKLSSEASGIDPSFFWVYLCDIPKMAEFGSIMPNPGGEAEWIASLPQDVKERYRF